MTRPAVSGDVIWKMWESLTSCVDNERRIFDRTMRTPHGKLQSWIAIVKSMQEQVTAVESEVQNFNTTITPERLATMAQSSPEEARAKLELKRDELAAALSNHLSTYGGVNPAMALVPDEMLLSQRAETKQMIAKVLAAEVLLDNNLLLSQTSNPRDHGILGDSLKRVDSLALVNEARARRQGLQPILKLLSESEFNTVVKATTPARRMLYSSSGEASSTTSNLRPEYRTDTWHVACCRSTTVSVGLDQIDDWSPFIPGLAESGKLKLSRDVFDADREMWIHNAIALYDHASKTSRHGSSAPHELTSHGYHDDCSQCLIYGLGRDAVDDAPPEEGEVDADDHQTDVMPAPWTSKVSCTVAVSHKMTREMFADQMLLSYTALCACTTCHFHFSVTERARYWLKQRLQYRHNIMNPYAAKWSTIPKRKLPHTGQDDEKSLAFTTLLDGLGAEAFAKGDELATIVAQLAVLASASAPPNTSSSSGGGGISRPNRRVRFANAASSSDSQPSSASPTAATELPNHKPWKIPTSATESPNHKPWKILPSAPRVAYVNPLALTNILAPKSPTVLHLTSYILIALFNTYASPGISTLLTSEFVSTFNSVVQGPAVSGATNINDQVDAALTIALHAVYDQVKKLKPFILSNIVTSLVGPSPTGLTPLLIDTTVSVPGSAVASCIKNISSEFNTAFSIISNDAFVASHIANPNQRYKLLHDLVASDDHVVDPRTMLHTGILDEFVAATETSGGGTPKPSGNVKPTKHVQDTMFIVGSMLFPSNPERQTSFSNYFFDIRNTINVQQGKPIMPAHDLLSNRVLFGSTVTNPDNLWMHVLATVVSVSENWLVPEEERHLCSKARQYQYGARHKIWTAQNASDAIFDESCMWIHLALWKKAVKLQKMGRALGVGLDEITIAMPSRETILAMKPGMAERTPPATESIRKALNESTNQRYKWDRLMELARKQYVDREHLFSAFDRGVVPGGNESAWKRHASPAAQMKSVDSYLEALTVLCSSNPHYAPMVGYFWPIPQECQTHVVGQPAICDWLLRQMWTWYYDQDKLHALVSDTLQRDIQPRANFSGCVTDVGHDRGMTESLAARDIMYAEFAVEYDKFVAWRDDGARSSHVLEKSDVWCMSQAWMSRFWIALKHRVITDLVPLNAPGVAAMRGEKHEE